ncbi:Membrane dipeptidase (Peptidase family M19) [Halalkalibacter krulwichiae]|uniref:Membrane dipeptidase (Peptidase family M19) n=2 Tax=Halalkalibacter krulwichiae TaxID=199441 RepID=A0A1X9MBK1_9BACI|nr:Membrane dipeptidase (Peptidase family M19) [Halalkalibacter krulwichiae]
MNLGIIDTHCDALLKLWEDPSRNFESPELDTNLNRLKTGNVKVQLFAIFVEPFIKQDQKFQVVLEQIELFHKKVLGASTKIHHIKQWSELEQLKEDEIGAVLTLEGVDAIGDDLTKLEILHQLGVISVGLTWNQANLCADGVGEPRGAGLTLLGKELVRLNNKNRVLTDVSHLSIKGFWDVMELARFPIASHSNARSLCDHPRNLNDDQIMALIKKQGYIGVVFCPSFVKEEHASISDVLSHIDHLCSLGAQDIIGFGSDFDGITDKIPYLSHSGEYEHLVNELAKYYSSTQLNQFLKGNFKKLIERLK